MPKIVYQTDLKINYAAPFGIAGTYVTSENFPTSFSTRKNGKIALVSFGENTHLEMVLDGLSRMMLFLPSAADLVALTKHKDPALDEVIIKHSRIVCLCEPMKSANGALVVPVLEQYSVNQRSLPCHLYNDSWYPSTLFLAIRL